MISRNAQCTGCSACSDICPKHCISMTENDEGFLYPEVNLQECINCGLCDKVCSLELKEKNTLPLECYASYAKSDEDRFNGSSGGIFGVFAKKILQKGGIVYGAVIDPVDLSVKTIAIDCICDLHKLEGSKYVQSDCRGVYKEVKQYLEDKRYVLFTGTPCQINALKLYLGKDYRYLICVDIICHGVPSPYFWKQYCEYIQEHYKMKIDGVSFRDKTKSWKDYVVKYSSADKKSKSISKDIDLYLQSFIENYNLRYSCYQCNSKQIRLSDITLGDCWGIEKMTSSLGDDGKGVSAVIIRTPKGMKFLSQMEKDIYKEPILYEEIKKYNTAEHKSVNMPPERTSIYYTLNKQGIVGVNKKYRIVTFKRRVRRLIKKMRGGGKKQW